MIRTLLALGLSFAFVVPIFGQTFNLANETYLNYVVESLENTKDIDGVKLRELYVKTTYYNPYGDLKSVVKIQDMLEGGRLDGLHAVVVSELREHLANVSLHYWAMLAYAKTKNEKYAKLHQALLLKLLEAIERSGDGRTFDTAFQVISPDEEYIYLTVRQDSIKKVDQIQNDHNFDVFDVVDKSGKTAKLYFNLDGPSAWLNKR